MGHKEGISLEGISERRGHRHAFVYERVYEIIARDSDATGSTTFSKRSLAASLDCSLRSVDTAIQRVIEIINSFPQLPMWLALAAAVPSDWGPLETYFAITVTLSLLSWTGLARVVRGKILSLREEDYAVAARLLGASHPRILFRHLLPAFASHIIVTLTLTVPGMILGETSLSFLGLGLRPPVVSWGVMLQDCMNVKAVIDYPWLLAPVLMLVFAVLCFNFLGDGLRDAADPYASK